MSNERIIFSSEVECKFASKLIEIQEEFLKKYDETKRELLSNKTPHFRLSYSTEYEGKIIYLNLKCLYTDTNIVNSTSVCIYKLADNSWYLYSAYYHNYYGSDSVAEEYLVRLLSESVNVFMQYLRVNKIVSEDKILTFYTTAQRQSIYEFVTNFCLGLGLQKCANVFANRNSNANIRTYYGHI